MKARTFLIAGIIAAIVPHQRAEAQISVVGESIHEAQAAAGSEYHGTILIRNDDTKPHLVRVHLTDYSFTAEGKSQFDAAGSSPRSNGSWVALSAATATISPGQSLPITYRVSVPDTANGSYWSMAMVEVQSARPADLPRSRGVKIQTVIRHGIQIVTHAGTRASAAVQLSNVEVTRGPAGAEIRFDALNVGARARRLSLSVDLYRADGAFVGRFEKARGLVYPGSSIRQSFALDNITKGEYLAFIVADAGDDDLFAGNFKVKL
ncbi:MAG: hypothetical protein ACSLFK_03135 [Gemmatimonadaceae bacterium]